GPGTFRRRGHRTRTAAGSQDPGRSRPSRYTARSNPDPTPHPRHRSRLSGRPGPAWTPSPAPGLFNGDILDQTISIAEAARRTLLLAVRIATIQNRAEDLESALHGRTPIELACGVIMAQNRCSQQDALTILTRTSNHRSQKLRVVAAELVADLTASPIHAHFD
ncbi:UNVERIFIED_ORG: hypothetical protein ABIB13_003683, partial [Arthrobacter sp. UYEF2]